MTDDPAIADDASPEWPQRTWPLAAAGAAIGVSIRFLFDGETSPFGERGGAAIAVFLIVTGLISAFMVERGAVRRALIFAGGTGTLMASVF